MIPVGLAAKLETRTTQIHLLLSNLDPFCNNISVLSVREGSKNKPGNSLAIKKDLPAPR